MQSALNGRADTVGPAIQLGSFLPEKRTVVINDIPHEAWVTTNRRYPRRIQARLDTYRVRYVDAVEPLTSPRSTEGLSDIERAEVLLERQRAIEEAGLAYQRYMTDSLMALIPTLDEDTAELLDTETARTVLQELGYFEADPDPVEQTEGSGDSDETPPLTGDMSSPDLPDSMPTTALTDS